MHLEMFAVCRHAGSADFCCLGDCPCPTAEQPHVLVQLSKTPVWAEGNAGARACVVSQRRTGGTGVALVGVLGMAEGDPLGACLHCHSLTAFRGCPPGALPGPRSPQCVRITSESQSHAENQAAGCSSALRYLRDMVAAQGRELTWSDTACS